MKKIISLILVAVLLMNTALPICVYAKKTEDGIETNVDTKIDPNEGTGKKEDDKVNSDLTDEEKEDVKEAQKDILGTDGSTGADGEFVWDDDNKDYTVLTWESTDWSVYQNKLDLPKDISSRAQVMINDDIKDIFVPIIKKDIIDTTSKDALTEGVGEYADSYSRDSYGVLLLGMIEVLAEQCGVVDSEQDGGKDGDEEEGLTEIATNPDEDPSKAAKKPFTVADFHNEETNYDPVKYQNDMTRVNKKVYLWAQSFGHGIFQAPGGKTGVEAIREGVKWLFIHYCVSVDAWCRRQASADSVNASNSAGNKAVSSVEESSSSKPNTDEGGGVGDAGDETPEPYPNRADETLFSVVQGTIMQYSPEDGGANRHQKAYSSEYDKYSTNTAQTYYKNNKASIKATVDTAFSEKYNYKPDPEFAYSVGKIYSAFSGYSVNSALSKYVNPADFTGADGNPPLGKISELLSYASEKLESDTQYVYGAPRYGSSGFDGKSFDCSSFCHYCMRKIGIKNPPGQTADYPGELQEVPGGKGNALPGDILIKSTGQRHAMICLKNNKSKRSFTIIHSTNHGGKSGVQITENRSYARVDKAYRWWSLAPADSTIGGGTTSPSGNTFIQLLEGYNQYVKAHPTKFESSWPNSKKTFSEAKSRVEKGHTTGIKCVVPIKWAFVEMGIYERDTSPLRGLTSGFNKYTSKMKQHLTYKKRGKPCGMTVKSAVDQGYLKAGDIVCYKGRTKEHLDVYSGIPYKFYDAGGGALHKGGFTNGIIQSHKGWVIHEVMTWKN